VGAVKLRRLICQALNRVTCLWCRQETSALHADLGRNFGPHGDSPAGVADTRWLEDGISHDHNWVPICGNANCRRALYSPTLHDVPEHLVNRALGLVKAGVALAQALEAMQEQARFEKEAEHEQATR